MLLTVQELQQLRNDAAPFLSGTAVIKRPTDVSDNQGGFTQTWQTVDTVPARLEPVRIIGTGRGETGGELPQAVNAFAVITPSGTDLRPIDRVVISGKTFEVTDVRSPRTDEVTNRASLVLIG